jgi:hypothetical protein
VVGKGILARSCRRLVEMWLAEIPLVCVSGMVEVNGEWWMVKDGRADGW